MKCAVALLLSAIAPSAQPSLLADTAFVHGAQAATRPEADLPLRAGVPADWSTPIPYATGTAHFRLEILDKPTGVAIRYQPCLERGTARACAAAQLLSDSGATRAVYTWSQALAQWTPSGMAWSARPDRLVLVLQDAYGRPITPATSGGPDPTWVGQPFTALYYPLSVRFSAAVMPAGGTFPGWPGLISTSVAPVGRSSRRSPEAGLVRIGGTAGGAGAETRLAAGFAARAPGGPRDLRGRRIPVLPDRGGAHHVDP